MKWSTAHPTKPGLYWISVEPRLRNPEPWKMLDPIFQLLITPRGDVFDLSNGKDEPLYTTASLPQLDGRVKYASASGKQPSDPWPAVAA